MSVALTAGVLVVSAAALWYWVAGNRAEAASPAFQRASLTLAPRDFVRHIRLTGTTEATRSYIVSAPLLAGSGGGSGSLVVTRLAPAGSSADSTATS